MPDLLPGSTQAAISDNIRVLRQQGHSEQEAIARAQKYARNEFDEPEDDPESEDVAPEDSGSSDRQWVVVTKDFSGLGWAKKLQEEGERVTVAHQCPETEAKDKKLYANVGKGWLNTLPLSEAIRTLRTDTTYWVFAENNFPEEADKLRAQGQKVFGTSKQTSQLEHDRQFAVDVAAECGLESPATHEFSSRQEGLSFLDENPDKAYVFKPDDGKFNYLTFVPIRQQDEDANRETYNYVAHMKQEPGTYILQERVSGVELNVEAWVYEGEPCFAFATLESKRKNTHDYGEMSGCAGDFAWTVPLESSLFKETIGKMLSYYKEHKYTGFADVNVILTDQGPLFLEVCNRFGYNAHINLFLSLALDSFSNILADFIDGYTDDIYSRFRSEIGSSITLFLDHPREGLPVYLDERWSEQFYPFDGYKDDDDTLLLTGYSSEVGVFVSRGLNIKEAAKACLDKLEQEAVSFPDMYYRRDLGETGYPNAPATRYDALNAQFGHSMRAVAGVR